MTRRRVAVGLLGGIVLPQGERSPIVLVAVARQRLRETDLDASVCDRLVLELQSLAFLTATLLHSHRHCGHCDCVPSIPPVRP